MAFDLTGTGPTYNTTGKFGASLNGGSGSTASNPFPTTGTWTLEGWLKTASSSGLQVAFGANLTGWIGVGTGSVTAHYGSAGNEVTFTGSSIADGAWHHVALVVGPSGGAFYLDGVSVGTNVKTFAAAGGANTAVLGVHTFGGVAGYDWVGEVDEVAIFSSAKYSAGFTSPTAAYANSAANIVALYHLDSNLLDSAAASGTVPGAPAIGTATAGNASASIAFTAGTAGSTATTGYTATSTPGGFTGTSASSPITVSGLTNSTAYTFTVTATNSVGTSPISAASNSVTPASGTNNALTSATGNVLFSPYTWNIGASTAKTINAGAYFKTIFGGTTCTLNFDMTGIAAPVPQISYRVDKFGPWINAPIAATIAITIPTDTSDYATKPGHFLEVVVKSTTETQNRWTTQATGVSLTGIILDASKVLTQPPALPLNAIYYGDSITEGVRTVNSTATNDTDRNAADQGWAYRSAEALGAEVGIVGFGATGLLTAGSGSVPAITSTYNFLYSGVARTFTPNPDFIVINEGTNDGAGATTTAVTTLLNGLLAATTATKIIVLRPFNGNQAANLQAGIAACTTPSRVTYVDTTGYFTSTNSSDALHPYGVENVTHIVPAVAAAIRPIISITKGTRTSRTISGTLVNPDGTAISGTTVLKWSIHDQLDPSVASVAADNGTVTATAGAFSFAALTTKASGGTVWLDMSTSDGTAAQTTGKSFSGPVLVA